jgi:hypothetical protein
MNIKYLVAMALVCAMVLSISAFASSTDSGSGTDDSYGSGDGSSVIAGEQNQSLLISLYKFGERFSFPGYRAYRKVNSSLPGISLPDISPAVKPSSWKSSETVLRPANTTYPSRSAGWSGYRPSQTPVPVPTIPKSRIPSPGGDPFTVPTIGPEPAPVAPSGNETAYPLVISEFSPAGEFVTITNNGDSIITLTGWKIQSLYTGASITFIDFPLEDGTTFTFELMPFQSATIYTGTSGMVTSTRLYWPDELFRKSGDTVYLINPQGTIASSMSG